VIEIRPATHDDVPEMIALIAAVAAEGKWIGTEDPVDSDRLSRLFTETIESDGAHALVAVDDDRLVGNLGMHPVAPGLLGLGMSVAMDHRGQGVGTQLMQAAIDWARAQGNVHKLELDVWPHNTTAQALYTKCGFVFEGRRRRQYRRRNGELWDSVVMGLVLDETSPGSSFDEDD
jgi:putative acetyltransferase